MPAELVLAFVEGDTSETLTFATEKEYQKYINGRR
jgi:hypothetical protein